MSHNSLNNGPLRQGSHESSKFLIVMQYPSDSLFELGFSFQQRGYSEIYRSPLSTAER